MKKIALTILAVAIIAIAGTGGYLYYRYLEDNKTTPMYLASFQKEVAALDDEQKPVSLIRGQSVSMRQKVDTFNDKEYHLITLENGESYYVLSEDLVDSFEKCVKEETLLAYRPSVIYENDSDAKILERPLFVNEEVKVIGFDKLDENGEVNKYKIAIDGVEGYVYGKYLTQGTPSEMEYLSYHIDREDLYGGGSGDNLDYYPNEKPSFSDNVMPEYAKAIYLGAGAVNNIDAYIDLALSSDINTLVIDIRDTDVISYESEILKEYSPTSYKRAYMTFEDYQTQIKKAKDAGLYLVGRITAFKDTYYAQDHPDNAIYDNFADDIFYHGSAYWPTPYSRDVWEYNVLLAKEAVTQMGFNEIQFDYVRFPDLISSYEESGQIDMRNTYNETKAQAIQRFLMYAADELHEVNAYVSADTFGETSNAYVTAYGQYWPAISNVADVISSMPYPDHFGSHDYGISEYVWEVPYKLLSNWGSIAKERQNEIPTPAKVRTWIQGYDSIKSPYVVYDADKIYEQAIALNEQGLDDGFIVWNAASSLSKYQSFTSAFKRLP